MHPPEVSLRTLRHAWLPAALALCSPSATLFAETAPIQQLHKVEQAIDVSHQRQQSLDQEAARLAHEALELKARLIHAAAAAQDQETAVGTLEDRLAALIQQEKAKSAALDHRRAELAVTLSALARLSRTPPEAMIASPESAVDTMRSSQLLGQIVPELQQKANALKSDLTALARLHLSVAAEQSKLADAIASLDQERKTLNQLLQQKAQERRRNAAQRNDEARKAERLAAEASDLKSLLEKLAAEERRRAAEAAAKAQAEAEARAKAEADANAKTAAEAQAKAQADAGAKREQQRLAALPPGETMRSVAGLPARGRVIGHFGQPNDNGVIAKGITIETRPGAEVIAPAGGKIVFAGPFRGYGQLLIIAHPGGYHILLAGFARIDGAVGQSLSAGEPVGQMSSEDGRKPTLYVELRRNGEPINPIPWLAASERKVSG